MPAYTLLLDVQVSPTILQTSENGKVTSHQELHNVVRSLGLQGPVSAATFQDGGTLAVFHNEDGSHATLRVYPQGLVTLDVQQWVEEGGEPAITEQALKEAEQKFRRTLTSKKSKRLVEFKLWCETGDSSFSLHVWLPSDRSVVIATEQWCPVCHVHVGGDVPDRSICRVCGGSWHCFLQNEL